MWIMRQPNWKHRGLHQSQVEHGVWFFENPNVYVSRWRWTNDCCHTIATRFNWRATRLWANNQWRIMNKMIQKRRHLFIHLWFRASSEETEKRVKVVFFLKKITILLPNRFSKPFKCREPTKNKHAAANIRKMHINKGASQDCCFFKKLKKSKNCQ